MLYFFVGFAILIIVILSLLFSNSENESSDEESAMQEEEKREQEKREQEKREQEKREQEKREKEKREQEKREQEKREQEKREKEKRELSKIKQNSNYAYIKTIGFLLLFGSWFFLYSLIFEFNKIPVSHIIVWGLYLFTQFFGLYLIGFGTLTGLHSLIVMGKYMSTIFIIIITIVILSIFNFLKLSLNIDLSLLIAINSLGIFTIIYVEKKMLKKSQD
jgi:Fe2+ transport system protein B